ncbi:hypothetical protein NP233_g2610 [Leucocoprinus birnbaumii]|uniref:Uncharacterized protein n=1 Tax=Leucocoprinus birnbaumii TaxID=56174 RepID=A0AAD5VY31_9AGAR|nr:hypothetical protein NP233_g2610 [Leucocoprinus birnbaumii]
MHTSHDIWHRSAHPALVAFREEYSIRWAFNYVLVLATFVSRSAFQLSRHSGFGYTAALLFSHHMICCSGGEDRLSKESSLYDLGFMKILWCLCTMVSSSLHDCKPITIPQIFHLHLHHHCLDMRWPKPPLVNALAKASKTAHNAEGKKKSKVRNQLMFSPLTPKRPLTEVSQAKKGASTLEDATNTTSLKITIPVLQPCMSLQFVGNIQSITNNMATNNGPQVSHVQANDEDSVDRDNMAVDSQVRDDLALAPAPVTASPPNNALHTFNEDLIDPCLRDTSQAIVRAVVPPLQHTFNEELIDPHLRDTSQAVAQAIASQTQALPHDSPDLNAQIVQADEGDGDNGWCSNEPSDMSDDEEAAVHPKKKKNKQEKEDYSFILGLMRGNEILGDIKRPRALPKPLTKSSFMSRRFRRALPLIVACLEVLAHQTGLYLTCAHA